MNYIIESEYAGKTVKDFLRSEVKPSNRLLTLLKSRDNGILVNDKRVTVRYILSDGDLLSLNYEDKAGGETGEDEDRNIVPNDSLLELIKVLYEDNYIIAFNKPCGMPSHPSINHFDDTLANAAMAYFKRKNQAINFRSVNRLDKNTSGIVLMAKNKLVSAKLNDLIKLGHIKKIYNAIIIGDIDCCDEAEINRKFKNLGGVFRYDSETKSGEITAPIKREKDSIIKRICAVDGDYSRTEFKVLDVINTGEDKKRSYLEVYPKTGRTHQIRVHFYSIGYPLAGDDWYFIDEPDNNISRLALHASYLEFVHPVTRNNISINCDPCEDLLSIKL